MSPLSLWLHKLASDVFESQKTTGSELHSYSTCLHNCEVSLISWYGHFWFPSVAEKLCLIKLSNNSANSGLNFSTLPQAEKVSRNFSIKSTSYDVNTKSTYRLNVNVCTINTPSLHEPWRYAVGETWWEYTLCSNSPCKPDWIDEPPTFGHQD